jgi:N-carbamoyl-L-amino-acid hydrolase
MPCSAPRACVDLVNRIGHAHAPLACATVGMVQVHPNSRNVIPGRVFFTVDIRHPEDAVLAQMDSEVREGMARIAAELKVEVQQSSNRSSTTSR